MNESTPLTQAERAAAATPERIRVLQMIYIALGGGVVALAAVLGMIAGESSGSEGAALMSLVHGATALGAFSAGMILFPVQRRGLGKATTPERLMQGLTVDRVRDLLRRNEYSRP